MQNLISDPPELLGANPFHSDPFRSCWLKHLAQNAGVKDQYGDFVLHHKKAAKGLVTLKELKFFGGAGAWYQDFTSEQVQSFLALQGKLDWDYFYGVWAGSREQLQAFDELEAHGYLLLHGLTKPMHMINLSEGYLATKPSKYRSQVRAKIQKVQALQPKLVTHHQYEEIEPFLKQFFSYHIPYWTEKSGSSFYSNPCEQAFAIEYHQKLHQAGKLIAQTLYFNDDPVNLNISFSEGGTLFFPLMINTGLYLEYHPGLVSLYLGIEDALRRGFKQFNMGYGEFMYKTQAETHRDLRNVIIIPNPASLKGRLVATWFARKIRQGIRLN